MGKVPLIDFESLRAPAGEAPGITATVTEPAPEPEVTPPTWPAYDPIWDQCEIPDFLLRNKDGSWTHPELHPSSSTTAATATEAATVITADASSGAISGSEPAEVLVETPPVESVMTPEEMRKHVNMMKKNASLARLRQRTADDAARNEGKVWRNGRFVHHDSLTKGEYSRIMRELPTMDMKRIFAHLYSEKVE